MWKEGRCTKGGDSCRRSGHENICVIISVPPVGFIAQSSCSRGFQLRLEHEMQVTCPTNGNNSAHRATRAERGLRQVVNVTKAEHRVCSSACFQSFASLGFLPRFRLSSTLDNNARCDQNCILKPGNRSPAGIRVKSVPSTRCHAPKAGQVWRVNDRQFVLSRRR